MKTRMYENGGYIYIDTETVKGWHHCDNAEFFANLQPYNDELEDKKLKWVGAPIDKDTMKDVLALVGHYPKTEVMICLYYNTVEKKWLPHVPKQKGSPAHVAYDDEQYTPPEGYEFLGTIHTHPNMSAFWSGTDTNDQGLKNGLHIVLGLTDGKLNTYKCSLFLNKKQYDQEGAVIMPEKEEALPEAKKEWLDLVEEDFQTAISKKFDLVSNTADLYKKYNVDYIDDQSSSYTKYSNFDDYWAIHKYDFDYGYEPAKEDEDNFILDVEEALNCFSNDTAYALVQEILTTLGETELVTKVGEARLNYKEESDSYGLC